MVTSSKPFLVRAIHGWCIHNEYTPHVLIGIGYDGVEVPDEYMTDGQIVFNIAPRATRELVIDNDAITFLANFGQKVVSIRLPMASIIAIYAFENGEGITFDDDDQVEGTGGISEYVDMNTDTFVEKFDANMGADIQVLEKKPKLTIIKSKK